MDTARFDAMLRSLATSRSCRGLLAALTGSLLTAGPGFFARDDAAAKKRGGKKGKGKGKGKGNNGSPLPSPPSPRTCAQLCPMLGTDCLHRVEGAPLCSSGYGFDCTPCSSDQDCLQVVGGLVKPYCITATTNRATGITTNTVGPGTNCQDLTVGQCASVFAP